MWNLGGALGYVDMGPEIPGSSVIGWGLEWLAISKYASDYIKFCMTVVILGGNVELIKNILIYGVISIIQ
jgi:hypothetical protein